MKLRSSPNLSRQRSHYRNGVRLPIILSIVIVGLLVGSRWFNEVRAQHLAQKTQAEVRKVEADILELRGHIKDLEGRAAALLTRDAVHAVLKPKGIHLDEIRKGGALAIHASNDSDGRANIAQAIPLVP